MTKRRRPTAEVISNNQEADRVLFKLKGIAAELQKNDNEADAAINKIKQDTVKKNEPLKEKLKEYETALAHYAQIKKDELFNKKKSIELNFGLFGFRVSSRIKVKKSTLEKLIQNNLTTAVKTKQSVDRSVLKDFSDEVLSTVDAERITEDSFYYELKSQNISEVSPA